MEQVIRYACEECWREHQTPKMAKRCERHCVEQRAAREAALAAEKKYHDMGHDTWHEDGERKHAPRVDPDKFGSHDYGKHDGTEDCRFGCGCWAGPCRSGGPVNPFGACPNNPLAKE